MAKDPKQAQKKKHIVKGPCEDCHTTEGEFTVVRRQVVGSKGRIIKLCAKCAIKP
ncbi:MAG: hypothetical protein BWZ02_00954 [Lentisphaerae bacterium ADurb.BinA184]|nr:MAG: hypothetical protein BWZ02_00954 [Lentisphaerae bacterium ADurb.BinA184]